MRIDRRTRGVVRKIERFRDRRRPAVRSRSVSGSAKNRIGRLPVRVRGWLMRSLHGMHLLWRWAHCLRHHRRGIHRLLVVGELWSVRVLLSIGIGDGLIQGAPHGDVVRQVRGQSAVEVCRPGLEMGGESSVLEREVVILLFVHLLIDDILLRHPQRATCASFVDLGCSPRRLDSGLETSIAPPRGSNVGTVMHLVFVVQNGRHD